MENETLLRTAEAAGVQVRFIRKDGLGDALRGFVGGRTVCAGETVNPAGLGPALPAAEAEVGIARARLWVEETATALVTGPDAASLLPPVSVLIVDTSAVVPKYEGLVDYLKEHPDEWLAAVTGPSRTADIEKVLVIPAHGPRELHLLIVE
jgi:hypothetical protein